MSNVTAEQAEQSQSSGSAAGQVKEAVGGAVEQAQEQVGQVRGQARQRLSEELSSRSSQAGEQVRDTGTALRETGRTLRQQGKTGAAKTLDHAAGQADRLASYLSDANGDRMLRDVERFARRQPWLFTLGGVVGGFLASRFLKASSEKRFEGGGDAMYSSGRPQPLSVGYGATAGGDRGVDGR
jgi:hypothetical protein